MPTSNLTSRIRNKTVYLLGAGFSAGCGIPVLSRFIPAGLKLLKDDNSGTEFVEQVEATLHEYLPAAEFLLDRLVNLEDIFCLVDLRKQYAAVNDKGQSPRDHENTLKRFVVEVLSHAWDRHESQWKSLANDAGRRGMTVGDDVTASHGPPVVARRSYFPISPGDSKSPGGLKKESDVHSPLTDQHYNVCAYHAFLSQVLHANNSKHERLPARAITLDHADVIVTLNYDLVIEKKLRQISDAAIYYGDIHAPKKRALNAIPTDSMPRLRSQWPKSTSNWPLPLLKIHGSINWQTTIDGDATDTSAAAGVTRFWNPRGNAAKLGKKIRGIPIIPPTWRKSAASNTVFARLLGEALRHMRLAETIVIVGYSLPSTDAYFRYLLAEALGTPLLPNIELWDIIPPAELKKRITGALDERIESVVEVKSIRQRGFVEMVASRQNEHVV